MNRLITGQWIKKKLNLLITGPTGVGKTWIACALGNKACRDGFTVQYHRLSQVVRRTRLRARRRALSRRS